MIEKEFFNWLLTGWIILALIVFISLFFYTAPYGRYRRRGWGFSFSNKMGWIIMEAPAPCIFFQCFLTARNTITLTLLVFLIMWETHYVHRAFIYPFSLRGVGRRMPIIVVVMGMIFNSANAIFNGYYIYTLSDGYANVWLLQPPFFVGALLFIMGYVLNRQADRQLRGLRAEDESDYKIASNGMFRFISCPNYLGEIVIWVGWALATWSLPGLAFALWTMANLAPRAWAHHAWYQQTFPEYPSDRKALVPWLW
jgi:3-oxo-5-alpha-steroid 4-dehydrogenase 1